MMRGLANGLVRSDAAAARKIPHGLTDWEATPEQLWELLQPVRGGRARVEYRLRGEASRDPEISATLREGAELIRRSLQYFEEDYERALLLTDASYGAHMLRFLTETPASRAAPPALNPGEERREK